MYKYWYYYYLKVVVSSVDDCTIRTEALVSKSCALLATREPIPYSISLTISDYTESTRIVLGTS